LEGSQPGVMSVVLSVVMEVVMASLALRGGFGTGGQPPDPRDI